ncbi:MAG: VWA domain-containing protein [Cyanobacteria bacterium SZAS LIN-5]|nr:VWA domain-containing protein [Cyanobacteria bacterium SZAS LIN-5]
MRKPSGQVAIALNLVIALFVVGSLGIAAYEMTRILLAREQLKNCLEFAALAGTASLASSSASGAPATAEAKAVALNMFKMNSILGQPLASNVREVPSLSQMNPTTASVDMFVEFDDPISKQPTANPSNVMRLYGAYKYVLFSGGFGSIGVLSYNLTEQALSALPALDLILVHDNSSSMDDLTPVTVVRRYYDPNVYPPQPSYTIPTPGGAPEQGPISGVFCPVLIGTPLNGLEPQNLDAAGDPRNSLCLKEFSEVGNVGTTVPLRGVTNTGAMPGDAPVAYGGVGLAGMSVGPGNTSAAFGKGNAGGGTAGAPVASLPGAKVDKIAMMRHQQDKRSADLLTYFFNNIAGAPAEAQTPPAYNPWGADASMFTDVVVNIDGNNTFNGTTIGAFSFPDYRWLVEASRGNLENGAVAPDAIAPVQATQMGDAANPGYRSAYRVAAYSKLEPKGTIDRSLLGFVTKVAEASDCHFGFVGYNDRAGTSPTDTNAAQRVSWAYTVAGTGRYLIPAIPLEQGGDNIAAVSALLSPPQDDSNPMFVPNGGSNLADGLQKAYDMLTGPGARTGAMKAVVVVTDKVPTRDLAGTPYTDPAANGPAIGDALVVAQNLGKKGIPIFMVGFDHTGGAMTPYMQNQFSDVSTNGIVGAAGHGGVLHTTQWTDAATSQAALNGKFNNIVRQLVVLNRG